ncbi:MAG: DMT family transporter [Anaerolineae bacterium]|nr:DMT family transporter [Anaerolineae bacterium]
MTGFLGIIFGLASGIVWGSGDFFGGRAALKANQYQAVFLSGTTGWLTLLALMLFAGESLPSGGKVWLALLAGVGGSLGLLSLYRGLSMGNSALVAPTSAVTSAAVTVIYGSLRDGLPDTLKLVGFGLGLIGIWLVAQSSGGDAQSPSDPPDAPASKEAASPLLFALLAGLGFGAFFIFISQIETQTIFSQLVVSRLAIIAVGFMLLMRHRQPIPLPHRNFAGVLAGVFDAGGNVLFLLAKQYTRLDVASVLSSLYPASTVLLSLIILKEHLSQSQIWGLFICLVAVGLIAV